MATFGAGPAAIGGLSKRARAASNLVAVALLTIGVASAYAAGAAPLTGQQAPIATMAQPAGQPFNTLGASALGEPLSAGASPIDNSLRYITAEWDSGTTHLDWSGQPYMTAEATFVGDRVISPGDRIERTLYVTNDGPTNAVMSVELAAAPGAAQAFEALSADIGESVAEHLEVFWDIAGVTGSSTFASFIGGGGLVAEVAVPKGATVALALGKWLPTELDHHNDPLDTTGLSFDVYVRMAGATNDLDPLPPGAHPGGGSGEPQRGVNLQRLALTGLAVGGLVLGVASAALGAGWLVRGPKRPSAADGASSE